MTNTSAGDSKGSYVGVALVGLAFITIGSFILWKNLVTDPKRVFYGMVENSISAKSLTKKIIQSSDTQNLEQTIYFRTGANNIANAQATLSQGSESETVVTTESLGTPHEDFVRYIAVDTNQTSVSGKPLDFSKVIGIWGRSENLTQNVTDTPGELFSQVVLGVVPVGYIDKAKRVEVLQKVRELQVYETDFESVDKERLHGRPRYVYSVTMQPKYYVEMLKIFAESMGLEQLRQIDPGEFTDSPQLEFEFVVDVWSKQLLEVRFIDGGRTEFFSGYGAEVDLATPKDSVPIEELQIKLQAVGDA